QPSARSLAPRRLHSARVQCAAADAYKSPPAPTKLLGCPAQLTVSDCRQPGNIRGREQPPSAARGVHPPSFSAPAAARQTVPASDEIVPGLQAEDRLDRAPHLRAHRAEYLSVEMQFQSSPPAILPANPYSRKCEYKPAPRQTPLNSSSDRGHRRCDKSQF